MAIMEILLIASGIIVLLDIINLHSKKKKLVFNLSLPSIVIACSLIIFSYLYLAWAFITNSFAIEEVFLFSSSGLTWFERLYASWAGSAGSWLFLSFLFAVGYLIIRLTQGEDKKHIKIYQFLDLIFILIQIVVLLQSPFNTGVDERL